MRDMACAALALALILLPGPRSPVWAQSPSWQGPVNLSNSPRDSEYPSVAADPAGNVHVVWCEAVDAEQGQPDTIFYTAFDGDAWSAPVDVVYSPGEAAFAPVLAADPAGNLHMVWLGSYSNQVLYSRAPAQDAGSALAWSRPDALSDQAAGTHYPDLAVDGAGRLHVAYTVMGGERNGVYYTSSPDGGRTWSQVVPVHLGPRSGSLVDRARLAVDASGGIHVIWSESASLEAWAQVGVRYARSLDGGATWSGPLLIDGPYDIGGIAAVGDTEVHLVWSGTWFAGGSAAERSKFHRWSQDRGATWSPIGRTLERGGFQGWPGLAIDGAAGLHLVQVADAQTAEDAAGVLFYQHWSGAGWSGPERLLSRPNGAPNHPINPDIAVGLGNQLHVVVSHQLQSLEGNGTWVYDILYFRGLAAAPRLEPQAPVPSPMPSPPTSTPAPVPIAEAATSTAQPGPTAAPPAAEAPQPAARDPALVLIIGLVPALLLIAGVLALRGTRRR